MYLTNEVFCNFDSGLTSQYLYKDSDNNDSLFYAGPPWDYESSIGNGPVSVRDPKTLFARHRSELFSELYNNKQFYNKVKKLYQSTYAHLITDIADNKIQTCIEEISSSASLDKIRWENAYRPPLSFTVFLSSLEEHVKYLQTFLTERKAFLDSLWINNEDYCIVTIPDSFCNITFYVKYGEKLDSLPMLESKGYHLTGYNYENTDKPFDISKPITEDIILTPRWAEIQKSQTQTDIIKKFYIVVPPVIFFIVFLIIFVTDIRQNLRVKYRRRKEYEKPRGELPQ
jgi:hypothetical protein